MLMQTILIIDDDVALMARLATQLTEAGYDVLRASRAQHAELLIAEGKADLALLDERSAAGGPGRAEEEPLFIPYREERQLHEPSPAPADEQTDIDQLPL